MAFNGISWLFNGYLMAFNWISLLFNGYLMAFNGISWLFNCYFPWDINRDMINGIGYSCG
jgi:hypothetical protein